MKILFLAPFPCTLPVRANTVRLFHWLKYLSPRHDVTFVHFVDPGRNAVLPSDLCCRSVAVVRRKRTGLVPRAANLLSRRPYFLGEQFRSEEMFRTVEGICREGAFDVVHCSSLAMAQYVPPASGRMKVLEGVDCNARNNLQQAGLQLGIRTRLLSWLDWRKLRRYEPEQYGRFDAGLLASPQDRDFLLGLAPRLPLHVLPSGVDLAYFSPQPGSAPSKGPEVVFVGPLDYAPNRDAVGFFCSEVLPLILQKRPETIFRVLGRVAGVKPVLRGAAAKNVLFSGHVPDMRPFLTAAGAVVCPLRMGTGIKNKVLEAMAMGKALVMTPVAAEGVRASAERDYLCASSPRDIAEALLKILSDPGLASGLGASARKAVEAGHDWTALAAGLESFYEKLLPV
jgi:glycosyltransferase involved in cell wall biosynthesis